MLNLNDLRNNLFSLLLSYGAASPVRLAAETGYAMSDVLCGLEMLRARGLAEVANQAGGIELRDWTYTDECEAFAPVAY